jgi:hypothetical protein
MVALTGVFVGCATESRAPSGGSGGAGTTPRAFLPAALGSRWTPPEFASRLVEGERVAVFTACVATAETLGYAVSRQDVGTGRILAERRQTNAFDGSRQDTLELTVAVFEPGSVRVSMVLRETVEAGGHDERSAGLVAAALVRDRPPYDSFFKVLRETLARAETP